MQAEKFIELGRLKRRLARQRYREAELAAKYQNNEQNLTFHAGFDIGYVKGKISEIEVSIDALEDEDGG